MPIISIIQTISCFIYLLMYANNQSTSSEIRKSFIAKPVTMVFNGSKFKNAVSMQLQRVKNNNNNDILFNLKCSS